LSKHHRYMILIMPTIEASLEHHRILTGIQLLTVQSMLMFVLAVTCDIQVRIYFLFFLSL
jgi:hypothetical protein